MSAPVLFPPSVTPRVFAVPLGVDFPTELLNGLQSRLADQPPHAIARVEIMVNTRRMERRLRDLLTAQGRHGFLPKIRLITDIAKAPDMADLPPARSALSRQLELSRLVDGLLQSAPDLAPQTAVFDLTKSLVRLLDECEGEGVALEDLAKLDVGNLSAHWERSLQFLSILAPFLSTSGEDFGPEGRQRLAVLRRIAEWQTTPPNHPILIAGSTGSRGTTALLMDAVARLPQGAVILPGFDTDQPESVWTRLRDPMKGEDHPQFRFASLLTRMEVAADAVPLWSDGTPACLARNKLVSLALRPAPVTDQWRDEGDGLVPFLPPALQNLTLVEANSAREEALAIAIALKDAAATNKRAALITPDRMLTRQVTAALDRWRIEPDDSAGRPLSLSAPGRFLRHLASMIGQPIGAADLLVVLKHPLSCSNHEKRGDHLRHARDLELFLRKSPDALLKPAVLAAWAQHDDARQAWTDWVFETLAPLAIVSDATLAGFETLHREVAERLSAGPGAEGTGGLWDLAAGTEALRVMDELRSEGADGAISLSPRDYLTLLQAQLAAGEVRDPTRPDQRVMIWGTLEARVQGADLVILAGLNEGVWPGLPDPDPWMNRQMRHDAKLLVPERQIGLSAHDFQQAIGAKAVILSRATRDADAETVPSRWLNRLTNLLTGLGPDGTEGLKTVRARGTDLLHRARTLDRPAKPARAAERPSPRVRPEQFPERISASRVETLVRDPFTIYAQSVLNLRALDPLEREADAAQRGTVFHRIMETALKQVKDGTMMSEDLLRTCATDVMEQEIPWPDIRLQWRARFDLIAPSLARDEDTRLAKAVPNLLEERGVITLENGVVLSCEADRIDRLPDGQSVIYDYKTGALPSAAQIKNLNKQLHLEAVIAEGGGFLDGGVIAISSAAFLGLSRSMGQREIIFDTGDVDKARAEFTALLNGFLDGDRGFTARRMPTRTSYASEFDHLSRFGEWEDTDIPASEDMP